MRQFSQFERKFTDTILNWELPLPVNGDGIVGGSKWRIETEFETEKSDVGLDEYEARSGLGGIIPWPCAWWLEPSC